MVMQNADLFRPVGPIALGTGGGQARRVRVWGKHSAEASIHSPQRHVLRRVA